MTLKDEIKSDIEKIIERGECDENCDGCSYWIKTADNSYCSGPELSDLIFEAIDKKCILLPK